MQVFPGESCGFGGWAYSITSCGKEIACGARLENIITNGDMEIKAVTMALRRLSGCRPASVLICSDYNDVVRFGKGRFSPRKDDPRLYAFESLREAVRSLQCRICWKWIKGHNGNRFNELCDRRLRRLISQHMKITE